MSKFNYCPICGQKRVIKNKFCQKCNFEFITGKYVKLEEDNSLINIKKVSQEEFIDATKTIKINRNKINYLISNYLYNSLKHQFNGNHLEKLEISIAKYISNNLNNKFNESFDINLDTMNTILESDDYLNARKKFIQWIDENRSHLPIFILNNYKLSVDKSIKNLNNIINLDMTTNKENEKFIKLINSYLLIEKEFQEKLI
jgi:hypothetical protein